VNQDERASQLSAMFDGELPAAECELLSRRLARDEQLRATWSRYAVIGAALRAEPMAQVRPDFARRVSAALASGSGRAGVRRTLLLRRAGLGAAVAAGVAGAAIMLLRSGAPAQQESLAAYTPSVARVALPAAGAGAPAPTQTARQIESIAPGAMAALSDASAGGNELASYVVPPLRSGNALAVPASLADYVVAHSEVSSPLARRSLLSALVGDDAVQPVPAPPSQAAHHQVARQDGPR
jgi:sigma-E factor negative regulatory protein RseA